MKNIDKVHNKVKFMCFNYDNGFFSINRNKIADKFAHKYYKLNDVENLLDLDSIRIESNNKESFSYVVCNLFSIKINQIITVENINVSHSRVLIK